MPSADSVDTILPAAPVPSSTAPSTGNGALDEILERDPSLGGRFEANTSLTTVGRASLYGMVAVAVVVAMAAIVWFSVDFALSASTGEGCLAGLLTVLGVPVTIGGFVHVFSAPANIKIVYSDAVVGDAVSEEGRAIRICRAVGLVDGHDGVAERPLEDVMNTNPSLNGRFTVRTSWNVTFLALMLLAAMVPLGVGGLVTWGAFHEANNPIHSERQFDCEFVDGAFVYLCDKDSNLEATSGYCENHSAVDGYWRCTDDFGQRQAWSQSANWSHLMDGTTPDGISMKDIRDQAFENSFLGFTPMGFATMVGVMTVLFSGLPLAIGITAKRWWVNDDLTGETLDRDGYRWAYADAIGSATRLGNEEAVSKADALGLGLILLKKLLRNSL